MDNTNYFMHEGRAYLLPTSKKPVMCSSIEDANSYLAQAISVIKHINFMVAELTALITSAQDKIDDLQIHLPSYIAT